MNNPSIDLYTLLGPQLVGIAGNIISPLLYNMSFSQLLSRPDKDNLLRELVQLVGAQRLPQNIYMYIYNNQPWLLNPVTTGTVGLAQMPIINQPQPPQQFNLAQMMQMPQPQMPIINQPQPPRQFNLAQMMQMPQQPVIGQPQYMPPYMMAQGGPFAQQPFQQMLPQQQPFQQMLPQQFQQQQPFQQMLPQQTLNARMGYQPRPEAIFTEGEPKYPYPNGREIVKDVLTEDWIYRNRKGWPLIPLSDFEYFRNSFSEIAFTKMEDPLMVPTYEAQWPRRYLMHGIFMGQQQHPQGDTNTYKIYLKDLSYNITDFSRNFYDKFPHIRPLLEKYKGKLAVCGGAVTRTLLSGHHDKTDVDLFFYKSTKEEAFAILLDCVATLVSGYKGGKAIIERKLYVTSVILENERQSSTIYQFIHRIYPTLDSILGGFDIGPAMVGFDGEKVYGTPLGIYSIVKRVLVVDTTRRSTSFEHRIMKYARAGFAVIFPGITIGKYQEVGHSLDDKEFYQKARKANLLIRKLGLYIERDFNSYNDIFGSGRGNVFLDTFKVSYDHIKTKRRNISDYQTTPEDMLRQYTDYGSNEDYKWKHKDISNGTVLRSNNIEAVSVFAIFPQLEEIVLAFPVKAEKVTSYNDVIAAFIDIVTNPQLKFDETYKGRAFTYITKKQKRIDGGNDYINRIGTEIRLFAEMAPKMRILQAGLKNQSPIVLPVGMEIQTPSILVTLQKEKMDEMVLIVDLLNDRMKANLPKAQERLTGMQWIDQDPGRQWTSSINPIIKKPEDFYGEYYVPFGLGIPCDIETTMRLARKFRKGSFFAELPTDLFKLILIYVLRAYTYNIPRKPNAWEPAVVQPTTQPSKVEKPLDYFSELALANGGDLRPKGKREQREEDQRLRNLLPAAQVNFPAFNVLGQQQFQPQFHQQFQPLGQQRFQPQQNNQTFEDSSDDDEREETNNPTTIPNIRIPTASFSESPYNILYDPLPRTILENDLPSNLLIIGIGLYLDEDTGIVYSKFNNAWMITGRIDN